MAILCVDIKSKGIKGRCCTPLGVVHALVCIGKCDLAIYRWQSHLSILGVDFKTVQQTTLF